MDLIITEKEQELGVNPHGFGIERSILRGPNTMRWLDG